MILLGILSLLYGSIEGISCKGPRNTNVDWFIVYKPPKGSGASGTNFFYLDNNNPSWIQSPGLIGDENQPLGTTAGQIYSADHAKTFAFMYNDDSPLNSRSNGGRGHAKGVVLSDNKKGFWMVHSAPNFPHPNFYSYPETAAKYGQIFLCVTIPVSYLPMIGDHLRYIQADPYYSTLPDIFKVKFPVLQDIVNKHSLPSSATIFTKSQMLQTDRGDRFMAFAKHKKFAKVEYIWLNLVANELQSPLAVQGWLNGASGDLNTDCSTQFNVYDIQRITLPNGDFLSSRDHSKWAVGENESNPIVCIGDMNRQVSQTKRGGGAVCLRHPVLWRSFYNLVAQTQPCPVKSKKHFTYPVGLLIGLLLFSIRTHSP